MACSASPPDQQTDRSFPEPAGEPGSATDPEQAAAALANSGQGIAARMAFAGASRCQPIPT